jgi:hypothetical protein
VCYCIYAGSKNDSSAHKKDNSFPILADIANFPPDTYNKIDLFMVKYVEKIPESQIGDYSGMKPVLFTCTSLYKTRTLDSLVNAVSGL